MSALSWQNGKDNQQRMTFKLNYFLLKKTFKQLNNACLPVATKPITMEN